MAGAGWGLPQGWQPHDFWGDLARDAQAHPAALAAGLIAVAVLSLGWSAARAPGRPAQRFSALALGLYFSSLPLRAGLLSAGLDGSYDEVLTASTVCVVWGAIGAANLLLFDVAGRRLGVPKIIRDVVVIVACVVALGMTLSRAGVNLLSIITTSAVITAVIGLSLQETLGNVLSGMALQLESAVAVGDWVRVEEKGQVGVVRELRWRSMVIETRNGDLVVIPNQLVTKGVLTLYAKDGLRNRRWIYFNVHLRHPPNLVQEKVLAALEGIPNVAASPAPDCIVMSFEDSAIKYAVRYRLLDFRPDDGTDSEVRKRVWYALRRYDLEMPYPAHNVFLTELDGAREAGQRALETERRLKALAKVELFAPLSTDERARLAAGLRHEIFGRDEVILRAGDPGDSLYVIRAGVVSVRLAKSGGTDTAVAGLSEGQCFGEMSLMTGEPRAATVVAVTDVECYVVDRALFQQVLMANQSLAEQIGQLLHQRELGLADKRALLAGAGGAAPRPAVRERIRSFFGLG